jgi:hypothetical protein
MEVEQNFKTHAVDACKQLRHWLTTKLEYQRQWNWSRISKPMQLMHAVPSLADNQARIPRQWNWSRISKPMQLMHACSHALADNQAKIPKAMEVEQNFKTHMQLMHACSYVIG